MISGMSDCSLFLLFLSEIAVVRAFIFTSLENLDFLGRQLNIIPREMTFEVYLYLSKSGYYF